MADCPILNNLNSNSDVTTTLNKGELRLSTYTRTVGTTVNLSCLDDFTLVGQSSVTCKTGGWDYTDKPYCKANSTSDGLSTGTKILIGAVVGGVALVLFIIILIACCMRRKSRKAKSDQEKFYNHLQEENTPKGQNPGEMIGETQYKPPSYAAAWPAMTHSFMIGKREFPFRNPDSDAGIHAGKSIWDGNDYFIGKPEIDSENKTESKTENLSSTKTSEGQYSIGNTAPFQSERRQNPVEYRQRSISSDVDNSYSQFVHPISNRYSFQREISDRVKNDSDSDDRRTFSATNMGRNGWDDRKVISTQALRRGNNIDDDVRIPSRYLKSRSIDDQTEEKRRYSDDSVQQRNTRPFVYEVSSDKSVLLKSSQNGSEKPNDSKNQANEKPKGVYQGNWPMRDDLKSLTEFNKRALLHNRDPFLWRPVDNNFGFDAVFNSKF
ncbi:uncharacterized protein LOC127722199 [Mytilus californianus]|uniref:uncharacterized protein LOC127722199 n=1 Tax=Mytilus californianus TaxID=6549 RepID=UPI0022452A99|nr:uncharacterized protein LOC127722199 [Mytilus californianus]